MVRAADDDDRLRAAAFAFLGGLSARSGGTVSWHDLQRFVLEWRQIPLVGQTGIRRVRGYEAALTILTTYRVRPEDRPYEDDIGADGYPRYKWRGTDPAHADNVALGRATELGKPLAWLEGVEAGVYLVHAPVWLVGEEPERHQFVVCTSRCFVGASWRPTARCARSVGSATANSSTRRTSMRTRRAASRWCRTGSRCPRSITGRSTPSCWACVPTM